MSHDLPPVVELLALALAEDLGVPADAFLGTARPEILDMDVTSSAVVPEEAVFRGVVVARSGGVVCGLPIASRVFELLGRVSDAGEDAVESSLLVDEGALVPAGTPVADVRGPARVVLAGERTALNILMTLSGIATEARRWRDAAGDGLTVCDTRKTYPGLRGFSKYAVRVGGARNHRAGLYDMALIKDNHVRLAGGVAAAVDAVRRHSPELAIEVEAETIEQAMEAASAGADIVLLDNMDDDTLAEAVALVKTIAHEAGHPILTEASGGITFERLPALRETGVDRVSTSAITLAPPLDFALDETRA